MFSRRSQSQTAARFMRAWSYFSGTYELSLHSAQSQRCAEKVDLWSVAQFP